MHGYGPTSYGDAFADVYDEWYGAVSDVDATVALMTELGGTDGRVLELGVGTGRLALPMAAAGLRVTGLDASDAMLARLRASDPGGTVETVLGDMAAELPQGPFEIVLVAYNTLFNLATEDAQAACVRHAAARLVTGGRLVVEAFVPDEPFRSGSDVDVRSMSADRVVLAVTRYAPEDQQVEGHYVELTDGARVRLRPWVIRYSTVEQLDAMATAAGLAVEHRWRTVDREPFDGFSDRHVTVYRAASGA